MPLRRVQEEVEIQAKTQVEIAEGREYRNDPLVQLLATQSSYGKLQEMSPKCWQRPPQRGFVPHGKASD